MIGFGSRHRYYLYTQSTDMRKSFDGLSGIVRNVLGRNPLDGDNNLVENAIRPVAVGRKNWLFAGSAAGAQRSAMIYTIIETCKANGINPFKYLADVLDRIPARTTNNIDDLMP